MEAEQWKAIWQLNVPSRVKLFMWQAYQNILPTKMNLACKKITENAFCLIYGAEETTIHSLWACPAAKMMCGMHAVAPIVNGSLI